MKYGKLYRSNHNAVLQLNAMKRNLITLKEAENYGIETARIKKWVKSKKIFPVEQYKSNRKLFNLKKLIELDIEDSKK